MTNGCVGYQTHCYHDEGVQTRDYHKQPGCKKPEKIKYYVNKCCRCGEERLDAYYSGYFDR
jgi:hypothetical protein